MRGRRFRHDFYFPEIKTAVEVNGGLWLKRGAHTGGGQERDYEKAALTLLEGVSTLFVSGRHVRSGQALEWLMALIGRPSEPKTCGGAGCE